MSINELSAKRHRGAEQKKLGTIPHEIDKLDFLDFIGQVTGELGMRTFIVAVSACALVGCATSTGVIPFGKDTYTVSVSAEGGATLARRDALQEANAYCAQLGLLMMPVEENRNERFQPGFASDTLGTYDLIFRCLSEADPGFERPTPDRPDIVIENR